MWSTLFRIENEDLSIKPSSGRKIYPIEEAIFLRDANELIAEEIRGEVNFHNTRKTYSWTQSLGIALFKYNKYADAMLMILPCVELDIIIFAMQNNFGHLNRYCWPYNIYPNGQLAAFNPDIRLAVDNYIIRVADNFALNAYLKHYTGVGLKARIFPEFDREVIVRDNFRLSNYWIIDGSNLDAVYILYALQIKYNFLYKKNALNILLLYIQQYIENYALKIALMHLIHYLVYELMRGEQENLNRVLNVYNRDARVNLYYDGFQAAQEIFEGKIELAFICKESLDYIHAPVLRLVWDVFWYSIDLYGGKIGNER